jgi:hypothetical protein
LKNIFLDVGGGQIQSFDFGVLAEKNKSSAYSKKLMFVDARPFLFP